MEELRPVLADRLALSLINREQLAGGDFAEREGGAVALTPTARKTVVVAYQQRKQDEISHPLLAQPMPLGLVPLVQARLLARSLRGERDEGARYRAGLSAIEIVELIVEGLRGSALVNVSAENLRPATLHGKPGFRAELRFDSAAGLHYRGMLLGEGEDGSLSFLMYTAPAEYYFERDQAVIDSIFESAAE